MTHIYQVAVIEDDPYAAALIANLLSRDWRTRVAGVFTSISSKAFETFIRNPHNPIDALILDTEIPWNLTWPMEIFDTICSLKDAPQLILLCTVPTTRFWNDALLENPFFGGYVAKQEMLYSIASAVALACSGHLVMTESVFRLGIPGVVERNPVVIDGLHMIHNFTARERDVIRLGILFEHSQRDIEDELLICRDWIAEILGMVYEKLQLPDILAGRVPLENAFPDEAVRTKAAALIESARRGRVRSGMRRTPGLHTLAFHLLTGGKVVSLSGVQG